MKVSLLSSTRLPSPVALRADLPLPTALQAALDEAAAKHNFDLPAAQHNLRKAFTPSKR